MILPYFSKGIGFEILLSKNAFVLIKIEKIKLLSAMPTKMWLQSLKHHKNKKGTYYCPFHTYIIIYLFDSSIVLFSFISSCWLFSVSIVDKDFSLSFSMFDVLILLCLVGVSSSEFVF